MPLTGRKWVPALFIAGFAASAGAQTKACEIEDGTPQQVARAVFDLQVAQQSSKPDDALAKLKDAVKLLNDGDLKRNPVGRAFLLGKTYSMFLGSPSMANGMTTRGAIGYATDLAAPFDLYAGIDSTMSIVEASNPDCASQTAVIRRSKAWSELINQSFELVNADKVDSAAVLARRSLTLAKNVPFAYMVLAQKSLKDEKYKDVIEQYKLAVANGGDSAFADYKRQNLMNMGKVAAQAAQDSGPDRAFYIAEAKAAYAALAKDPGTKYADAARQGQADLALLSGDTAAVRATYQDQLSNPAAFSYNSLLTAGVSAARAGLNKDAIKLFEGAQAYNPYSRDVLYNLARLYLLDSAITKGIATTQKVLNVDPSNPDNFQLLQVAYQTTQRNLQLKRREIDAHAKALGQRANNPKSTKAQISAAIDSAARLTPVLKAYDDSIKAAVDSNLKYVSAITSIPARVTVREFIPTPDKATISGTVSNQGDAAKAFNLTIEFLDKAGTVVATKTVAVPSVEPKRAVSFSAEGVGAGIIAFRYKPPV